MPPDVPDDIVTSANDVLAASTGSATNATTALWPHFVYPTSGQLDVNPQQPFQWTTIEGAQGYELQVGTTADGNDVFDSGVISANQIVVPALPPSGPVYARVRAIPAGWPQTPSGMHYPRAAHVTFRVDDSVSGATFVYPSAGATAADISVPVQWQPDPLAASYRLMLGSSAGAADLDDSGQIHSRVRYAPVIPAGTAVFATLQTTYADRILTQSIQFTTSGTAATVAQQMTVAQLLTGDVRAMADFDNQPYDATLLAQLALTQGEPATDCVAFAAVLKALLEDSRTSLAFRGQAACLNRNSYDCHALIAVLDPGSGRWSTLDATFGLFTQRADGTSATAQEMSAAARQMAFSSLQYQFLTPLGDAYARAYYIDYPLLFVSTYTASGDDEAAPDASLITQFFDLQPSSISVNGTGYFAIQCAAGASSATALWNGASATYPCNLGLTPVFGAGNVALIPGDTSAQAIGQIRRFTF